MIESLRARRAQLVQYVQAYDRVIASEEACGPSHQIFPARESSAPHSGVEEPGLGISEVVLHPHAPAIRDDSSKALIEVRPPKKRRPVKRNGAVKAAEVARAAYRSGSRGSYRKLGKVGRLITLMREEIPNMPPDFSVDQLKEKLLARQPDLNVAGTAVNCLDMAARGELVRKGAGREARYTAVKLKNGKSAVEQRFAEFRATVPVPTTE